jgi:hypothetical protein
MRKLVLLFSLSIPSILFSQVHLYGFSGIHSPIQGRLSDFWKSGLEIGFSADVPVSDGLYLRGTIRQSWHNFRGDSLKALALDGPDIYPFLEEYTPHPPSDVTTTYDISGQLEYQTPLTSSLFLSGAAGLSCSIQKYGDVRVGMVGTIYWPNALGRSVLLRLHSEPRVFATGVFSIAARYDVLSSIGITLRGDYYTTLGDVSEMSFTTGIVFSLNR